MVHFQLVVPALAIAYALPYSDAFLRICAKEGSRPTASISERSIDLYSAFIAALAAYAASTVAALLGMAANAAFTVERLAIARPGDLLSVGPWQVQLASVTPVAGKNWTAVEAVLRATRGDEVMTLEPQTRYFSDPLTETNESAIRTFWNGQLYTVVGRQDQSGAWQLRLWWKPFVTLIWAGGALIALGGALALGGRLWRLVWRRRRDVDWRKARYA